VCSGDIWGDRTVHLSCETLQWMSAGKVFPNSLTIYKIHELRKEKLFIHERTSKAIVMLVIGEHLGECPPTDEGLCVGCEHRTHGYAIPGLPEKLKGRSVGNRVGWWWEVIKEQPHRHQQGILDFILSYRECDLIKVREKLFRVVIVI